MEAKGEGKAARSIKAHGITAFEFIMWYFTQDPNFIVHYIYNAICISCLRYITPMMARKITEEDIVHYCLNTSAIIHVKKIEGSIYGLDFDNIGWHCRPGSFDNSLSLRFNIDSRKVISFRFNDEHMHKPEEILAVLFTNNADCIHPMVHSFQNSLYVSMKTAPSKYYRMYVHGNYLNESAHVFFTHPWIGCDGDNGWFEHMIYIHSKRSIPFHSFFDKDLMAASPFLRFASKARIIMFQELKRAGLSMIDAEAYFLCSVIHSIDHWQLGKLVEWVNFPDMKLCPRYNYVCRNFYGHSQYCFLPNNYFRSHWHENDLYNRIYHRMKAVDPVYADIISISVSY